MSTKKEQLEQIYGQVQSLHEEASVLVKKNPNETLNAFKVNLINGVLDRANSALGADKRPLPDFSKFETDALPSASDVTMILGIYEKTIWKAIIG